MKIELHIIAERWKMNNFAIQTFSVFILVSKISAKNEKTTNFEELISPLKYASGQLISCEGLYFDVNYKTLFFRPRLWGYIKVTFFVSGQVGSVRACR